MHFMTFVRLLRLLVVGVFLSAALPASAKQLYPLHEAKKTAISLVAIEATMEIVRGKEEVLEGKRWPDGKQVVLKRTELRISKKTGVGMVVDSSGLIVTNAHIVEGAKDIFVTFYDGRRVRGRLIKNYPENDVAFLRAKSVKTIAPVVLADSSKIRTGSEVFTVGNSRFLKGVVVQGKIVEIVEEAGTLRIYFSAQAYRGDSGSPVLDTNGRCIGILSKAAAKSQHYVSAVSSNRVRTLLVSAFGLAPAGKSR